MLLLPPGSGCDAALRPLYFWPPAPRTPYSCSTVGPSSAPVSETLTSASHQNAALSLRSSHPLLQRSKPLMATAILLAPAPSHVVLLLLEYEAGGLIRKRPPILTICSTLPVDLGASHCRPFRLAFDHHFCPASPQVPLYC